MMQTNSQLELAFRIVRETNSNLFLTGKAGTGKTTFLKNLKEESPKRMIVVAPTGVAAINAGGVTIHSFFQIPFGPYLPGKNTLSKDVSKLRKEKMNIMRTLDLLVIDEISMVRADLLDCVDDVLRRVRRSSDPFGGVQLLMIGDTQQLTPVVKDDEWALLHEVYETPYFFSSQALRRTNFSCVELKQIFRQEDEAFIAMLNKIRDNQVDDATLAELNSHCKPHFNPDDSEGYIRLTTHNATAQRLNESKLSALKTKPHTFKARIEGIFPEYAYPTDAELVLKENAQVMFIKNDSSPEKRYYNGKVGVVKSIDGEDVVVEDRQTGDLISVGRESWENVRYELNKETNEIEEKVDGLFEQYPLKTAWAITIHKSQGLTFERAIIDAAASFSHGQVYVALSRCKRLEGMVLSSPITLASIRHDSRVDLFNREMEERVPDNDRIADLHRDYFVTLVSEQFSFDRIFSSLRDMRRLLSESFAKLYPNALATVDHSLSEFVTRVGDIGAKFVGQVRQLATESGDVDGDAKIRERTQKAAAYFQKECETIVSPALEALVPIQTDNKELAKHFNDILSSLQEGYDEKIATLRACADGFSVASFLRAKTDAIVSAKTDEARKKGKEKYASLSADILHPELYERLREWRKDEADAQNYPAYMVLAQKALVNIANLMPANEAELLQVQGVGKGIVSRYGEDILAVVEECVEQFGYERKPMAEAAESVRPPKRVSGRKSEKEKGESTYDITLRMYKAGKSTKEIAEERGLVESTIESHLLRCVERGELDADVICPSDRLKEVSAFIAQHPDMGVGDLRKECGEKYTWAEIRLALMEEKRASVS
ncbi:MAG: AAA family ATPase [Paludibacteraceae bacterium]|nr:AAA family ATPase [Paludibacteraceae bacterium]